MNEPESLNTARMDLVAEICARIETGFSEGVTTLEMHRAIAEYFRKVTETIEHFKAAGAEPRGRLELAMAQIAVDLVAQETSLGRDGLTIEFGDLDRTTVLLTLCETIIACLSVAKVLDMDIDAALRVVGRHISTRGGDDDPCHGPVRQTEVRVPLGKLAMQEFV
ncbi:hypothetical protein [Defluviimonas sp. WL0075]|uniref:NTP pyrophosphohydrolase MazG putative catalytic core domain-containing protein n=1 Tax=Albidovulum sediminicola TaxID=2984331 RepID=A0ABT2Z117_9RHOB|nr:hypothetical protein [Defluviimonas sp. WL0075]MCV2864840.1 hypothetical protein [Defluviimonas sp. WL0075]